jgi:hypothetical protein
MPLAEQLTAILERDAEVPLDGLDALLRIVDDIALADSPTLAPLLRDLLS